MHVVHYLARRPALKRPFAGPGWDGRRRGVRLPATPGRPAPPPPSRARREPAARRTDGRTDDDATSVAFGQCINTVSRDAAQRTLNVYSSRRAAAVHVFLHTAAGRQLVFCRFIRRFHVRLSSTSDVNALSRRYTLLMQLNRDFCLQDACSATAEGPRGGAARRCVKSCQLLYADTFQKGCCCDR